MLALWPVLAKNATLQSLACSSQKSGRPFRLHCGLEVAADRSWKGTTATKMHILLYMIQGHGKHPRNLAYTYQDLGGDQVPTQLANSPATSPRPLVARPSRMQKETLTNVKSFNYTRGNMVELNMEDGDRKEVLLEVEPEPVPAGPRWQRAPAATEEKLPGVGHTAGTTPGRWSVFAVADD